MKLTSDERRAITAGRKWYFSGKSIGRKYWQIRERCDDSGMLAAYVLGYLAADAALRTRAKTKKGRKK